MFVQAKNSKITIPTTPSLILRIILIGTVEKLKLDFGCYEYIQNCYVEENLYISFFDECIRKVRRQAVVTN